MRRHPSKARYYPPLLAEPGTDLRIAGSNEGGLLRRRQTAPALLAETERTPSDLHNGRALRSEPPEDQLSCTGNNCQGRRCQIVVSHPRIADRSCTFFLRAQFQAAPQDSPPVPFFLSRRGSPTAPSTEEPCHPAG